MLDLLAEAERSVREGDVAAAHRLYMSAGDMSANTGGWKLASRCYRHAVELDLFDPVAVQRLATLSTRAEWSEYASALRARSVPRFDSRAIRLVVGNEGSYVSAVPVGTILEVLVADDDLVEVHPVPAFEQMPLAMALLVMWRALWSSPRGRPSTPMVVRLRYHGRHQVRLDENGDWKSTT